MARVDHVSPAAATVPLSETPASPKRLAHLPPLDGIRGLGIPFVLAYHHEAVLFGRRFGGGYLTVSMFFTLSGFLICRLLVAEYDRTNRIDLRTFYGRRFKRLMPAALVTLVLIAQVWWLAPPANGGVNFWSWFSSLTYWQNWYLIGQGNSYNDLFSNASPTQHMWSLSLEEQVYIVFPLILFGLLRWRVTRSRSAAWLTGLAAAGFAMGWFWNHRSGPDRAYYALEARAAEFLIGAAFAVWWLKTPSAARLVAWMRTGFGNVVGVVALIAEVGLWYCVNLNTTVLLPKLPLFPVWALVNGIVVCVIMAFAEAKSGPSRLLTWKPLTYLGQISYGTYLVHWPVFLFFSRERYPEMNTGLLFLVRVVVTFAITIAIFRLVEDPVRRNRLWSGRTFTHACVTLSLTGVLFAAVNPGNRIDDLVDVDAVAAQQRVLNDLRDIPADAPTRSTVDPSLPSRVLFVGDSQSWALGSNLAKLWGEANGVRVVPSPGVGCGVSQLTPIRYLGIESADGNSGCRVWRDALPQIVRRLRPQVVVIVGGFGDLADRQIPGLDGWTHIGQPDYDRWLRAEMMSFAALMSSSGARIVWLSHPYNSPPRAAGTEPFPEEDPARMDRYNALIQEIADADPADAVGFADFAALVREREGGEFDLTLRPDGAHIDLAVAPDLIDWLVNEIRRATPVA